MVPSWMVICPDEGEPDLPQQCRMYLMYLMYMMCFMYLKFRLNRMGDEGCKVICDALKTNAAIERFNIGSNSAGDSAKCEAGDSVGQG